MYFSHLMLCDRREGLSSQERYEQQLAEVRLLEKLGYWCCWFAEQAAMVDCLSHGRLELGFGRGYQPHEFTGFGVPLEESHERFEQALRVVTQALDQGDGLTYTTPLFHGEHVTIWPRPVQRPIPYWGAAISEASFTRYGQLGWPILTFPANQPPELLKAQIDIYRRVYCEHGHDPALSRRERE
jgi:alkanesulfonate monooxygenase SsuD/methylene tetrahydromethanopterin reductase-like flavin-dependent oxidoreductase (luciferase family)